MTDKDDLSHFIRVKRIEEKPIENCLGLAGLLGIHNMSDVLTKKYNIWYNIDKDEKRKFYYVQFGSDKVKAAEIIIKTIDGEIIVETFKTAIKQSRAALSCLYGQVEFARKLDFKKIILLALKYGTLQDDFFYNGFYSWGRYGFLMYNIQEYIDFLTLMKAKKFEYRQLYDLLRSEEGKDFWLKKGGSWNGYFDTHPDSISSLILEHVSRKLLSK